MAYETYEENQRPELELGPVDRVQLEAAKSAENVEQFRNRFHQGMNDAIADGEDAEEFAGRATVIDSLEEIDGHLKLEETESDVLGFIEGIGTGDENIRIG